jgi:hypothetical protein
MFVGTLLPVTFYLLTVTGAFWKTQISNLTVVKGSLAKNIPNILGNPKCFGFALLRLRITSAENVEDPT